MRVLTLIACLGLLGLAAGAALAAEGMPFWVADVRDSGGPPDFVTTGSANATDEETREAPAAEEHESDLSTATTHGNTPTVTSSAQTPSWVADVRANDGPLSGGPPGWVDGVKGGDVPPSWNEHAKNPD
jgi:hypothetical protein